MHRHENHFFLVDCIQVLSTELSIVVTTSYVYSDTPVLSVYRHTQGTIREPKVVKDEDEGGERILAGPWDVTNARPTLFPGVLDLVRGPKELGFKWAVNCGSGWV